MTTPRRGGLVRAGMLAAALLAAVPALAQFEGPPPGGPDGREMDRRGPRPFAGMSEAGRRAVTEALRPSSDVDRAERARVGAARDRMLAVLGADRLDPQALKRAMDDERDAATAMHARRQAAVLQALQVLSTADRRAFVADAKSMRSRFEKMDKRDHGRKRGPGGMDGGPPFGGPPIL